ncbi:putative transmembrane protein [Spiroplasma clarkii]|uniref:Uncharacterized protein n=1 Tax=Spiroplasma clarkii TaxID=2139 RepID=A0A1Y0L2R4_9MOLU|nr:hypothetical protein [Spiroplasma clarkii]ARU92008.1 putative transmembrane protein [Spiroplasma clarkii]ATX71342.1 hypothetical protein SCLAR_v1c10420 [Spiroplasma clarkii]
MKRKVWIDITFCSVMIFFIATAYMLSYISTTMGIMGEKVVVSIEARIFEDVTFLSVWCTTFALIYFIVKLFLTITRKTPIYFKYIEISVCTFAVVTMIVTTAGFILKITPPFPSGISKYRMTVNHYIIPLGLLLYLCVFQINYLYSLKEILLSSIPNMLIVTGYILWISYVFSDRIIRNEHIPFPYKGMDVRSIGLVVYISLNILSIFIFGFTTSLALGLNNLIIWKFHNQKYGYLYFKQNIFLNYENYD